MPHGSFSQSLLLSFLNFHGTGSTLWVELQLFRIRLLLTSLWNSAYGEVTLPIFFCVLYDFKFSLLLFLWQLFIFLKVLLTLQNLISPTDPQEGPSPRGHSRGLQPGHALLPGAGPGEEPRFAKLRNGTAEGGGHQPIAGGSATLLEPGLGPRGGHPHHATAAEPAPRHHAR